jgi:hypothetical protein
MNFLPMRILALLVSTAMVGCSTAAYEEKMQATAQQIKTRQDRTNRLNDNLHGSGAIGDAAVEIRVPKVFAASFNADSPHPADGGKVSPQRLQPPFLNLPNLKLTHEGYVEVEEGKPQPVYCYLSAVQGNAAEASKLADDLARQLRTSLPGGSGWETVECPTPEGSTLSCRRIRASGKQLFDATPPEGGRARFVQQEGKFDLYLHEGNGWITLVGFREPATLAEKFKLDDIGPLSLGTLKAAAPAGG